MHCGRYASAPLSRRDMLRRCAGGFGAAAFSALAADRAGGAPAAHHAPSVRSIIFLYMDGGVSQVDSFDPKPLLDTENGKPFSAKIEPTQFDNIGTTLASPWKFRPYGECGAPVSELFPYVAQHVDDLAICRSMVSNFSEHNTANFFLHTGTGQQGRPSMGAWVSYGLGAESANLPDFIVINGGLVPSGGMDNFGSGYLPATHQPTVFKPQALPIANLRPPEGESTDRVAARLALLGDLDAASAKSFGGVDAVESAIANYELAFRMQTAVPELANLDDEPEHIRRLYGLDAEYEPTQVFARECLLARRMVEQGVRFVELTCPRTQGNDRWDAHSGLIQNHRDNSLATDQPIAGLLADLKQRGLFDETLVVWAGEFGRTPFAQGTNGRDHNPFGFTIWMAGGGVRGGVTMGATDEFGYRVVEDKTTIHDLHATMLHLLGFDHTRLTFRFSGRDMRLTDVHGELMHPILA